MAYIDRYVDPDATGAGNGTSWTNAYNSLSACEAAQQQNLTDNGGDIMRIYCRSLNGTADTTNATFYEWTTSATCYIEIIGADFPTNGIWSDSKYRLSVTNGFCFRAWADFIKLKNIQMKLTETGANDNACIVNQLQNAGAILWIRGCILRGAISGSGNGHGLRAIDTDCTVYIYNTVIYGFFNNTANCDGIRSTDYAPIIYAYNCTISGCYWGIWRYSGTITAKNCAVFNNVDDFVGTITIDYCASDDGDGTHAQDFTAEATDWNKVFTDYANGDFSLKNYTTSPCCVGVGVDDPGSGLYSDDIIGTARS